MTHKTAPDLNVSVKLVMEQTFHSNMSERFKTHRFKLIMYLQYTSDACSNILLI